MEKTYKALILLFLNIVPIITIILNINLILPIRLITERQLFRNFQWIIDCNSKKVMLYWSAYAIIFAYTVIKTLSKQEDKRNITIILMILACSASGVMLPVAVWGERIALLSNLLFYCVVYIVINEIQITTKPKAMVCTVMIVICAIITACVYMIIYVNVHNQNKFNEQNIAKQLEQNAQIIEYQAYPYPILWNVDPGPGMHTEYFKNYFGISQEKQIKQKMAEWKFIFRMEK